MHRITPLPEGPSGKSMTLMLPSSRWNDPIHFFVKLRQCPTSAMWTIGLPTTTTIFCSSDSLDSSSNREFQALLDWFHSFAITSLSYTFDQPGWRSGISTASCQKKERHFMLRTSTIGLTRRQEWSIAHPTISLSFSLYSAYLRYERKNRALFWL